MKEIKFKGYHKMTLKEIDHKEVCRLMYNAACDVWPESLKAYDIVQFTGLYDYNHKEIYEGDILQYDHEDGKVTVKVIFKIEDKETLWLSGFHSEVISVKDYEDNKPVNFCILGNIYQHTDLLV